MSFTIEGRKSSSGSGGGTVKMKHREIGRNYRARRYAEAQEWWNEIEKVRGSHDFVPQSQCSVLWALD